MASFSPTQVCPNVRGKMGRGGTNRLNLLITRLVLLQSALPKPSQRHNKSRLYPSHHLENSKGLGVLCQSKSKYIFLVMNHNISRTLFSLAKVLWHQHGWVTQKPNALRGWQHKCMCEWGGGCHLRAHTKPWAGGSIKEPPWKMILEF